MKKQNTINFADIFYHAEEKFNMGWNTCNDVFFNTILRYKSYDDFLLGDSMGYLEDITEYSQCKDDNEKAWFILQDFMKSKKLKTMLVLND